MSDTLRGHNTYFSFTDRQKPKIASWLKQVKHFFHPKAEKGKLMIKKPQGFDPTIAYNSYAKISKRKIQDAIHDEDIDMDDDDRIPVPTLFRVDLDLNYLGEVLEGATVNYAVQLVANLCHYQAYLRLKSAQLIYQLGLILHEKEGTEEKNKECMENIYMQLQIHDKSKRSFSR